MSRGRITVSLAVFALLQIGYLGFLYQQKDQMRSDAFHGVYNASPDYMASNLSIITGIDFRDSRGVTLLMEAGRCGNKANVVYLLKQGADKTIRDPNGKTAYDITLEATKHGSFALGEQRADYEHILLLLKP